MQAEKKRLKRKSRKEIDEGERDSNPLVPILVFGVRDGSRLLVLPRGVPLVGITTVGEIARVVIPLVRLLYSDGLRDPVPTAPGRCRLLTLGADHRSSGLLTGGADHSSCRLLGWGASQRSWGVGGVGVLRKGVLPLLGVVASSGDRLPTLVSSRISRNHAGGIAEAGDSRVLIVEHPGVGGGGAADKRLLLGGLCAVKVALNSTPTLVTTETSSKRMGG